MIENDSFETGNFNNWKGDSDCATPKAWLGCMTVAVIAIYFVVIFSLLVITFSGGG